MIQIVDRVRDRLNPDLAVSEILVCRADARTNLSVKWWSAYENVSESWS